LLQPFRKLDHAKKYAIYFVATAEFAAGALAAARRFVRDEQLLSIGQRR